VRRGGQRGEIAFFRRNESRIAHAAQRYHRVLRRDGGEMFGPHGDTRYRDYAVDAARCELQETTFDPRDIVAQAAKMLRGQAENAGIKLEINADEDVALLRADERRVRQVLLSLLSNAIKFTPADREVCVSVSRCNAGLSISVADQGIGIAAEDIPRALEPFGQIDNRLARKYDGTGLGLPLSRRLVELHGGTLSIESALGIGTVVTVQFPATRLVEPPTAAPAQLLMAA
jgi:signal transduction histidine kinase